jgi:hypothetical protein
VRPCRKAVAVRKDHLNKTLNPRWPLKMDYHDQVPGNAWTAGTEPRLGTLRCGQSNRFKIMGVMKNYLLTLLQQCSEENFGQEAVEHAILTGALQLTCNLETDLHQIFDQRSACCDSPPLHPAHPHGGSPQGAKPRFGHGLCRHCQNHASFGTRYDEFIEAYRRHSHDNEAALVESYQHSGLLEEILRSVPGHPETQAHFK